MPLFLPSSVAATFQTNLTPGSRIGTTVTAGGSSHTKGSWASLIDPTDFASYGIMVRIGGVGFTSQLNSYLVDIGIADAGGGSEEVILPNLEAGGAGDIGSDLGHGVTYFFPVYIPSGVRVSARSQGDDASRTARIAVWLHQRALYPWIGCKFADYGTVGASSRGTAVPVGNGAWGTWTEIGTTSKDHRYWTYGISFTDTTANVDVGIVEIGYGPNSSSVSVISKGVWSELNTERMATVPMLGYQQVPSGSKLWCRLASGFAEDRHVIIYGG